MPVGRIAVSIYNQVIPPATNNMTANNNNNNNSSIDETNDANIELSTVNNPINADGNNNVPMDIYTSNTQRTSSNVHRYQQLTNNDNVNSNMLYDESEHNSDVNIIESFRTNNNRK